MKVENEYGNHEAWSEEDYLAVKKAQQEMLLRLDGLYREEQYVLWIVPDFFFDYEGKLDGEIYIFLKDGVRQLLPYKLCTPYPAKNIMQMSRVAGNEYLYGIPLIFNSFEELSRIQDITIKWDLYHTDQKGKNHLYQAVEQYVASFEKSAVNRFYSIISKACHLYSAPSVQGFQYLNEFAYLQTIREDDSGKYIYKGQHLYQEKGCVITNDTFEQANHYMQRAYAGEDERIQLGKRLDYLQLETIKEQAAEEAFGKGNWSAEQVVRDVVLLSQDVELTASPIADILPETSYGFAAV